MPEMDGYEVCARLKADPAYQAIPAIVLSACDEPFDKVKAFRLGAADYLTKPFQYDEAIARIEHQLALRRLQQEVAAQRDLLQAQNERLRAEIQARQQAQAETQAALTIRDQFIANMSHELRTPLQAIAGFTQLLLNYPQLNTDQIRYLQIVQRSSDHLLALMDDILDFVKVEAGSLTAVPIDCDLSQLLDTLAAMFQLEADRRGLALSLEAAADVPRYIVVDAAKLRSILLNLLSNALKFTRAGRVTLSVRREASDSSDCYLRFSVSDTGCGLAPDELTSIFQAFVQGSAGRQAAQGLGLGLAISQNLAQLLGGKLAVTSELGRGSTFSLTLPVGLQGVACDTAQRRRVLALAPEEPTYRLLIASSDSDTRLLLRSNLAPLGFELQEASDGLTCLALWETWQPDAMLVETRLSQLSGYETLRRIRALEADRSQRCLAIALTADIAPERQAELQAAGYDAWLLKPFAIERALDLLAEYLGIEYLYADAEPWGETLQQGRGRLDAYPDSFWREHLTQMPADWLAQLRTAAAEVDEEAVRAAIAAIPDQQQELRAALERLVYDFRLDVLLHATDLLANSA